MTLASAIDGLNDALGRLEGSFDTYAERTTQVPSAREEVHRLNLDRADLASQLDRSEDRTRRLQEANREVSRRLIAAMEAIRAVTERRP